jgi:hypothetical protein
VSYFDAVLSEYCVQSSSFSSREFELPSILEFYGSTCSTLSSTITVDQSCRAVSNDQGVGSLSYEWKQVVGSGSFSSSEICGKW